MIITWINHASCEMQADGVRLVCDPWLEGSAFNDGWQLLSETQFPYDGFAKVTHIWFSHEHPDHFSPGVLKKIPERCRREIVVMYRKTRDRRVVDFCKQLGFRILQLEPNRLYELGEGFSIKCGAVGGDSWLWTESEGVATLNVNDCVLGHPSALREVQRQCPRIDVLLTQFSYANWCGNRDNAEVHRSAARAKLLEIVKQIRAFKPRWVVPCASFVWFGHSENCYMNEHANQVAAAADTVINAGAEPVVLYPGDVWTVGEPHDSKNAIARYQQDAIAALSRPPLVSRPATVEALMVAARGFSERIRRKNTLWTMLPLRWLGYLRPIRIYLNDLDRTMTFDMFDGLADGGIGRSRPDLSMASDSLLFALKFEFGADTLLINGRFQEETAGAHRMLSRQFGVARYNNNGLTFPAMLFDFKYLAAKLR